jgi:hypothetical protein
MHHVHLHIVIFAFDACKSCLVRKHRNQLHFGEKEQVMQAEDPMLSMLRLVVAEARAILGREPRTASFERDIARLCMVVTIVSSRRAVLRLHARFFRGVRVSMDQHRIV